MIIDPDFLDHWRTAWLIEELGGDKLAPIYLLRLWGHCQVRRSTRFEIPAHGVKGICKAEQHSAIVLEQALIKCEYLSRDGEAVEVLKWAEQNAALIAAWVNGGKGGRPSRGKPGANQPDNPGVSDGMPVEVPGETSGDPDGTPGATQTKPIREEKRREETSLRSVKTSGKSKAAKGYTAEFEQAWAAYPRRPGDSKADAFKAFSARLKAGATAEQLIDGAQRYAAYAAAGISEAKYIKQGATFFGPGEHYLADWTIRSGPAGAPETANQQAMRQRAEKMTGGLASAKTAAAKPAQEVLDVH